MRKLYIPVITALSFYFYGCASAPSCCLISPPTINMTGQRTVIERQIVGDYKEIEEDAWSVSSLKTGVQKSRSAETAPGGDRELFAAMKIREFNSEKVRSYKKEGAVGESYTGYIEYRPLDKYEKNITQKKMLEILISEENRARTAVFKRQYFAENKKEAGVLEYQLWGSLHFAPEQEKQAAKGDWLKRKTGRWEQK